MQTQDNCNLYPALKFCFKTCVVMKFVDDDDDDDDVPRYKTEIPIHN